MLHVVRSTRARASVVAGMLLASHAVVTIRAADTFEAEIRPVLVQYCQDCHGPEGSTGIRFLTAETSGDIASNRDIWSNVAMQLRNRTMPPTGPQPSEADRMRIATWVDDALRATACDLGEFAGPVTARRLNRSEYQNTVRDLFGVHFETAESFPVDGSGGEGFDNNGETLFLSPLLAERYLEVARQILDDVIVTPSLERSFVAKDLLPDREPDEKDSIEMFPGESVTGAVSLHANSEYQIQVWIKSPDVEDRPAADILVDGSVATSLRFNWSPSGAAQRNVSIPISRGEHEISFAVQADSVPLRLVNLDVRQRSVEPTLAKRAAHFRLLGSEPGDKVLSPRKSGSRLLRDFLNKAFRRPVTEEEVELFLRPFDQTLDRGAPYEEALRSALTAILVSPDFLFRFEDKPEVAGPVPLSDHELATRLSYFLWGTMPDPELRHLADAGRLGSEEVLADQVERLLDHPRSRFFARTFIGQWLGTKDVGGRVAPTLNEIQHFYSPKIAADMREEPVLLFERMLAENRSLVEFVDADYTYLTERLALHYGMPGAVRGNEFQLVSTSNRRRGGLLGLGAVLAMNADYKRSSPVLRGVWTHETLLGTRLPAPPPETPRLETDEEHTGKKTAREMLQQHRADPACATCHDIIDPIGFALENYDWLGRWRDEDSEGRPVDAKGALPSGEQFDGPAELREALLARKDDMVYQVTRKVLGYALGRGMADRDDCTIQRIVDKLEAANYGARTLIREVVLSRPFRYVESAVE